MKANRADALEALVQAIYRAALDTTTWPQVLMQAADLLGGTSVWLSQLDRQTGEGHGITARIDPAMPILYQQRYAALNPYPAAGLAREAAGGRSSPAVLLASDLIDEAVLLRSEYYHGFMRPQDVHDVLIIRLASEGRVSAAININRPLSWGPFARLHFRMAQNLAPHLARAFHLGRTAGVLRAAPDSRPAVIVDAQCRTRHVNAKAACLLAASGGVVGLSRGRLSLTVAADDAHLRQSVARAASGGEADVIVSRDLILSVGALPGAFAPILAPDPLAIVLLDSLHTDAEAAQALFARALRLTPAESRVAYAFLMGDTPRDIARRFGTSPHTVRVQFAHIFTKASVTRQADLARLLDRLIVAGSR